MFKVSLLPAGYRHHLEGKKKKELISRIALVLLVCLFIVYGGIAIKGQILDAKLRDLQKQNTQLQQQFPALQKYQTIYNNLQSAQKMIESITPKDPEAVEFFAKISNITPDYVQVKEINLSNWFNEGVCTLNCTVQDYSDVQDYKALFETDEMKQIITSVQLTGIQRAIDSTGGRSVSFSLTLSMSMNAKAVTQAPAIVTEPNTGAAGTTGAAETTTGAEPTTSEGTTAAETTTGVNNTTTTEKGDA